MTAETSRAGRFERLYTEQCPAVRRYVRRRADPSGVEDAVSETFLTAMLVCWDGLDSARAARVIGTTAVAVRVRLHRARRRLAKQLIDQPTGELYAIV